MSVRRFLGILLLTYGLGCVIAGLFRVPLLWNTSNVQVFINSLGMVGTQVFVLVWGRSRSVSAAHLAARACDLAIAKFVFGCTVVMER